MSTSPVDEHTLWRAVIAGEGPALGRLFDLHRHTVLRQALRLLPQPADAEEVAAAAFFELWRKRASVRVVDGSVLPWLLVTTTNLARNSRRALVRHEALLKRLPRQQELRLQGDFERIDGDLSRSDVAAALRHLSSRDAALVTLTALEGYNVREVADLLEISENAARVRLHRAHAKLRGLLGATRPGPLDTREAAR